MYLIKSFCFPDTRKGQKAFAACFRTGKKVTIDQWPANEHQQSIFEKEKVCWTPEKCEGFSFRGGEQEENLTGEGRFV